jgi:antitoxin ParD1/3/4
MNEVTIMTTLSISLPDPMKVFLEKQVAREGYANVSEYLQSIIGDIEKRQARNDIEAQLLEGLRSPVVPMNEQHWQELERQVRERSPELSAE